MHVTFKNGKLSFFNSMACEMGHIFCNEVYYMIQLYNQNKGHTHTRAFAHTHTEREREVTCLIIGNSDL